jgi:DDE superfamily endonuclease
MTKYMMFGLYIIVKVLHSHPDARIEWKCRDPIYLKAQNDRIHRMAPALRTLFGIFLVGWIDGVRLGICKKGKRKKQKEDFSGEKKKHLRKVILISDSEGIVVAVVVNCPGSWGDSKCTDLGGLYELIDSVLDGYSIGADTAFRGDLLDSKITKILKTGALLPAGMSHDDYELLEEFLIKAHQPAEWANNCLIQSFRRLRQVLGIFDDLNGELMVACLLLHNYRMRSCSRNQVKKYFDILEKEEQEELAAAATAGYEYEEEEEQEEEEELFQIGFDI